MPNLEQPIAEALKAWEQALAQTQGVFVRYIELAGRSNYRVSPEVYKQIMELVQFSLRQSERFIQLLNQLGTESAALTSNPTALTVLNHIRRESEYFIGIAQALLARPM